MVFAACFRSRRKKSSTSEDVTDLRTSSNAQTTGKNKKGKPKKVNPAQVKLAPRTAVLQTPKQAVGNRITQATANRRRPTLEIRRENIINPNSTSLSSSHASSSSISPPPSTSKNAHQPGISSANKNNQETLPASPSTAQTTPSMGAAKFGLNSSQNDELRNALARRAAKLLGQNNNSNNSGETD